MVSVNPRNQSPEWIGSSLLARLAVTARPLEYPYASIPSARPKSRSDRQTYIVLRQHGRSRCRAHQVLQLGTLHPLGERAPVRELVHQRGEPPGEALGLPDATQASLRVGLDAGFASLLVVLADGFCEVAHVGGRQVEALGTRRRNDVRRVARQEQSSEPVSYTHLR